MRELKRWGKWFDNQLDKFSVWSIMRGRRGAIVFELAYIVVTVICALVMVFPLYIGFTLAGMPTHLALIIAPALVFLFFAGILIHDHLNPPKIPRRKCARCGMPAVLFCWKGPCAPGTWHCDYHYVEVHFPPEAREAMYRMLSSASETAKEEPHGM
jgi:hypothetical protein